MSHLRISEIEVENFKSLVDFKLELPKFSCLIGLNGAGKSTVLQFLDFLSQLVRGTVGNWLNERRWKASDLRSKLTKKRDVKFCIHFRDDKDNHAGRWKAIYSPFKGCCIDERIDMLDFVLEATNEQVSALQANFNTRNPSGWTQPRIPKGWKDWKVQKTFDYDGSILSAVRTARLPPSILDCKRLIEGIESLETLTPERLRQKTREADGSLGHGGRNLSAFLYELGNDDRTRLTKSLREAYPQMKQIVSKSLRSGWKQLLASENYGDARLLTEATHLNDGMLRIIAMLAELRSENEMLIFDEIENGINPELVEFVVNQLVKAQQQVLVTTHSPMILNYLDDETAKSSVIYLYKTKEGYTKAVPFFSIPSLKEKLEVMGPGEAFVDTSLGELSDEIASMPATVEGE